MNGIKKDHYHYAIAHLPSGRIHKTSAYGTKHALIIAHRLSLNACRDVEVRAVRRMKSGEAVVQRVFVNGKVKAD